MEFPTFREREMDTRNGEFAADGELYQARYAMTAVLERGKPIVGVCGKDSIVLVAKKISTRSLLESRCDSKIVSLDDNVVLGFSGFKPDAHVLITRAQTECQSHRLTMNDPVSVESIARFVAQIQHKYTLSSSTRPFAVGTFIAGFDPHKKEPLLYQTDPLGNCTRWIAYAMGNDSNIIRQFLRSTPISEQTVSHAIHAWRMGVELSKGNQMEVVEMRAKESGVGMSLHKLTEAEIDTHLDHWEMHYLSSSRNEGKRKWCEYEFA